MKPIEELVQASDALQTLLVENVRIVREINSNGGVKILKTGIERVVSQNKIQMNE